MLSILKKHRSIHAHELEDYDIAFLEHLKAEMETTVSLARAPDDLRRTYGDIVQRYSRDKHSLSKGDLYALDRLVLQMASADQLAAEGPGLYRRYCEERGEAVDLTDPAMKPATLDDARGVERLRARLQEILRALHWSYTFAPLRENQRVGLIEEAMVVMIVATIVVAGFLTFLGHHPFVAVLATVVYAGIVGGAVSCARRLSAVPTNGDALGSIYALRNSRYVLYFAPLTGAVFAVVTFLLFMGKVLEGAAFPSFVDATAAQATGVFQFTSAPLPATSKDYALLFLWCFIAGFAERFIPDTLSNLTSRASAQMKTVGSSVTSVVIRSPAPPGDSNAPPIDTTLDEQSHRSGAGESSGAPPSPKQERRANAGAPGPASSDPKIPPSTEVLKSGVPAAVVATDLATEENLEVVGSS